MKTLHQSPKQNQRGYALMLVTCFAGISLLVLTGALSWASNNALQTQRNNQYFSSAAAAEAATEKVMAQMNYDFQSQGAAIVAANLPTYRLLVPTASENSAWSGFAFQNAQGTANLSTVTNSVPWGYTTLASQYDGLNAWASTYSVISSARQLNTQYVIRAAVQQDFQVASIPIFQFAIYYSMDLEINPGPAMSVTGRVHGNSTIYLQPQASLTFQNHVTAVGSIIQNKSPLDPLVRTPGTIVFQGASDAGVASLNLPIGTNNTSTAVHAILEIPPIAELATSLMGKQRYYNNCDLIVVISNSTVAVKSGAYNNFATAIPSAQYNLFVNTNVSFYNWREAKNVKTTEIDIAKLKSWNATNALSGLGHDVRSIYVADMRTQTGSTESGVRVINGQTLPSMGLTVATPNPLYVKGHFNAPAGYLGTTNTTTTLPASLVGDSINVLSTSWSDANASSALGSRGAGNTTVNAAFLGGIVPSNGTYYSGGVENFPRFLEDWSGDTFTYNGSMVVMFYSQTSMGPWLGTGSTYGIYNAPTRNWTFDLNFLNPAKLPPGTPELRKLVRGNWSLVKG